MSGVSDFLRELENFKSTWNSMHARVLTIRQGDTGKWLTLALVVRLSAQNLAENERELFRLGGDVIILEKTTRFTREGFSCLLDELSKNVLTVASVRLDFQGFSDFGFTKEKRESWSHNGLHDTEGWPAMILFRGGKNPRELLKNFDEITTKLYTHDEPYENLEQLSVEYIGLPVGGTWSSCVYVVAPVYIKLAASELKSNGSFKLQVSCHRAIDLSDLELSVILTSSKKRVGGFRFRLAEEQGQQKLTE